MQTASEILADINALFTSHKGVAFHSIFRRRVDNHTPISGWYKEQGGGDQYAVLKLSESEKGVQRINTGLGFAFGTDIIYILGTVNPFPLLEQQLMNLMPTSKDFKPCIDSIRVGDGELLVRLEDQYSKNQYQLVLRDGFAASDFQLWKEALENMEEKLTWDDPVGP